MWKEILTIEDFNKIALLKKDYGCDLNVGGMVYLQNTQSKIDCHYYHYQSETIEMVKGYKQSGDMINLVAYTIKAEVEDYPEAIRLMAEHAIEYIKNRTIKKFIVRYGSENIEEMNNANVGVNKIGYTELIRITTEELEKLGFKVSFTDKELIYELI